MLSGDGFQNLFSSNANAILEKLRSAKGSDPVSIAIIDMIGTRIILSGNSLLFFRKHSPRASEFDAASILRTTYDAMLQGLYIMAVPSKRIERSQLYLDFMKIESKTRIDLIDASPTEFARRLSQSPKRAASEPQIVLEHNAVKEKFKTTDNKKIRNNWYPQKNLRVLAKDVGLESEYKLIQSWLSAVVHSSPLTLRNGPLVKGKYLLEWYWQFAFRILGAYAEHKEITLDTTEEQLIANAQANVFDMKFRNMDS